MQKWFYLIKGRGIPQFGEISEIIEAENEAAARLQVSDWQRVDSVEEICVVSDFSRSVDKFCRYVTDLKVRHNIYKKLFEDTTAQKLMEQTAPQFFLDIMAILKDYLLLEIAKITDPSKSGKYENFTVSNIIESNINMWTKDVFDDLCGLNKKINTFREYIVPSAKDKPSLRHKRLAHHDKDTFMSDAILGEFPEKEDEEFMGNLQKIASIMHKACFGLPFEGENPVVLGGVLDLKDALRKAVAFQEALNSESKVEVKRCLAEILGSM
jgi:hypothetical protein